MIDFVGSLNGGIKNYPDLFIPPFLIIILVSTLAIAMKLLKNAGTKNKLFASGLDLVSDMYSMVSSTIIVVLLFILLVMYFMKTEYPAQYKVIVSTVNAVETVGDAAVDSVQFMIDTGNKVKDGIDDIDSGVKLMTGWVDDIKNGVNAAIKWISNPVL